MKEKLDDVEMLRTIVKKCTARKLNGLGLDNINFIFSEVFYPMEEKLEAVTAERDQDNEMHIVEKKDLRLKLEASATYSNDNAELYCLTNKKLKIAVEAIGYVMRQGGDPEIEDYLYKVIGKIKELDK